MRLPRAKLLRRCYRRGMPGGHRRARPAPDRYARGRGGPRRDRPAPGHTASSVECRAAFPGVVRCSYYERRSAPAGPKEGGRVYEDDYLWYGFGCVRLRHVLSAVT